MRLATAAGSTGERDDSEINLTPMLDVVFIMLIFFIVTAAFIREAGVDSNLADEPASPQPEAKAITVRLDASNQIWIDDLIVDARAVRAHLERLHAANPDWPVVIDPDDDSLTQTLVTVIDAARLSRIENVSIAGD